MTHNYNRNMTVRSRLFFDQYKHKRRFQDRIFTTQLQHSNLLLPHHADDGWVEEMEWKELTGHEDKAGLVEEREAED